MAIKIEHIKTNEFRGERHSQYFVMDGAVIIGEVSRDGYGVWFYTIGGEQERSYTSDDLIEIANEMKKIV